MEILFETHKNSRHTPNRSGKYKNAKSRSEEQKKSSAKFSHRRRKGTGSTTEGKRNRDGSMCERNESLKRESESEGETKKTREVGEKGLFKGPSGSNVAFIGLLSAKHWSRAPR